MVFRLQVPQKVFSIMEREYRINRKSILPLYQQRPKMIRLFPAAVS